MSMLDQITPLILTRDEEPNLGRTLDQLTWARTVLIVDSFSTDATPQIASRYPNVRFLQRRFDTLAAQSNFGIEHADTEWVLLMDADYFVPQEFTTEVGSLRPPEGVNAYVAAFVYAVEGRPLRASLYPPRIVLLRKGRATVWQDGHAHRVRTEGIVGTLSAKIVHDDRKPFSRFLERQRVYMRQEAEKIRGTAWRSLPWSGRIRKLVVLAPVAALAHALFVKGLVLDGAAGWTYAKERFLAELILSRELLRRR